MNGVNGVRYRERGWECQVMSLLIDCEVRLV